jgi:carboxyl-terminal processing protease
MKTVTIVRNRVELQDQAANKLVIPIERDGRTEKYGVIKLPAFYSDFEGLRDNKKDARSTSRDVARLTRALVKEGIDGLIIDLRDNGGGSLEEVNVMVNQFVGRGPTVQIRDARQRSEPMASRVHSPIYKGPMAVITNRTSASASEIFAGAMQDYGRALILGTPTYGKGTVQTVERLSHGELKYTIAKFYRVSGQSTQEKGVHPDIFFPAIYDSEVIGEDVLPTALKWDAIPRAPYRMRGQLTPYVAKLDSKHQERTRNVPEFVYNRAQMALTASLRETKALPLQASERMNYQKRINEERLAIENRKRIALGEKPFNSIKALNDHMEEEAQDAFERRKQADAYLEEATWILSDLMQSAREKRVGQET